jgi:hypothetical protein
MTIFWMSRFRGPVRRICVGLFFGAVFGCDDQLPTFTGGGRFPDGAIPPTLERIFQADEFLLDVGVFTGQTSRNDASYLLVANDFDDSLSAHVLAGFTFPDTIDINGVLSDNFEYTDSSRVTITIPDTLAASNSSLSFELYTLAEPWDSVDVSWEYAVDRPGEQVPWSTPGGTTAELIGAVTWTRAAEGPAGDVVTWEDIPGETIARLASGETHGLMVVLETEFSQALISDVGLEASIIAESHPDTVVMRTITSTGQNFIYTPQPSAPDDLLRVGGITSDRSLLRLQLGNLLPSCPTPDPGCADLPPDEFSLNRVELLLEPVPVPNGFRPVAPLRLSGWRAVELDLWERSPLASLVDILELPGERFTADGTEPVALDLTLAVSSALSRGDSEFGIVLLVEPEASTFSYGWFGMNPRLRFVYTVPPTPRLP